MRDLIEGRRDAGTRASNRWLIKEVIPFTPFAASLSPASVLGVHDFSLFVFPVEPPSFRSSDEPFKDDRQETGQPFYQHRWHIIHSKWQVSTSAVSSWRSITDRDDSQQLQVYWYKCLLVIRLEHERGHLVHPRKYLRPRYQSCSVMGIQWRAVHL